MISAFAAPFMIFATICTYFSVHNKAPQLMVPAIICMVIAGAIVLCDLYVHMKIINNLTLED